MLRARERPEQGQEEGAEPPHADWSLAGGGGGHGLASSRQPADARGYYLVSTPPPRTPGDKRGIRAHFISIVGTVHEWHGHVSKRSNLSTDAQQIFQISLTEGVSL